MVSPQLGPFFDRRWFFLGRDAETIINRPHRSCAVGRQRPGDHEQRLQERPARVVRSDVYPKASHKNRAQLSSGD